MEIKNTKVYGLNESIIRSGYPMRTGEPVNLDSVVVSDKDLKRAFKLGKVPSGTGHDNFEKGIIVQFDLKYPQYFTPQLQRYNWIDIVSSQSKMHKLTAKADIHESCNYYVLHDIIDIINELIMSYNTFEKTDYPIHIETFNINVKTKKALFNYIISNLPMGYEMWMGISTNYLQLKTIYKQRKNHKLEDWKYFCNWIETLPMSDLIINKK